MSSISRELPSHLSVKNAVLVHIDVLNATQIIAKIDDLVGTVCFLDGYYSLCSKHITAHGGEVIKYIGDGCLAMFDEAEIIEAIDAVCAIRSEFAEFCDSVAVTPTDVRVAVHTGEIIVGGFGPEGYKDILGKTINILFSMRGRGITITEQVYRKLPSDKRSPWKKQGGHVVYVMK